MTAKEDRLTRRQAKAKTKNSNNVHPIKQELYLKHTNPLTDNQKLVFNAFCHGQNIFAYGSAGTGKTYLALYLSIKEALEETSEYQKVFIVRSATPQKDIGFLPGSQKQKMEVYEAPYISICQELFGRSDAYEVLKAKGKLTFMSTSYNRGITMQNCTVIVDEAQNCTAQELNTLITRIGNNCRIIFCGDIKQTDLNKGKEKTGIADFVKIIKEMDAFEFIEFTHNDIVRSKLVKEYIMTRDRLESQGEIQSLSMGF